jgi:transcription initiation factor TFIIIB Brf1 subunit/transcription initiation factor TFIIB
MLKPLGGEGKLGDITSRLNLPDVVLQEAGLLYKRSYAVVFNARCKPEACILIACRIHGVHHSIEEIAGLGRRPLDVMRTAYAIADKLGVEMKQPDYRRFIFGITERLGLKREEYQEILGRFEAVRGMSGHNPKSIIGALVYLYCKRERHLRMTMSDAGELVGMAEYTIRDASVKFRAQPS